MRSPHSFRFLLPAFWFALLVGGTALAGEGQIWVVSNGFHSAIALKGTDAPVAIRRAIAPARPRWILIGWGDRDFYMARPVTAWMTLKALCWPTPSAMHVVPLSALPQRVYTRSEVIELRLPPGGIEALSEYVAARVAVDRAGFPLRLGAGFSQGSVFILGNEKFYFPKMCNWWVGAGLHKAGLKISPIQTISAQGLVRQLRKTGRRVGGLRPDVDAF